MQTNKLIADHDNDGFENKLVPAGNKMLIFINIISTESNPILLTNKCVNASFCILIYDGVVLPGDFW